MNEKEGKIKMKTKSVLPVLGVVLWVLFVFQPHLLWSARDQTEGVENQAAPQSSSLVKKYEWHDKLKRGAVNIVTSPVEVARQIHITSQEKSLAAGWTEGLVRGLGYGLMRFGVGTIDFLTFPFGFPDSDKAPLLKPEYVWQEPGVKYI